MLKIQEYSQLRLCFFCVSLNVPLTASLTYTTAALTAAAGLVATLTTAGGGGASLASFLFFRRKLKSKNARCESNDNWDDHLEGHDVPRQQVVELVG